MRLCEIEAAILGLQSLAALATAPLTPMVWLGLCAGSLVLLRRRARTCRDPLLSPAVRSVPGFLSSVLVAACAMFCILPLLMVFNLEAQGNADRGGLGLTAVEAGLALLPMSASLMGFALWARRLVGCFSSRRAVPAGLLLVAAAGTCLACADPAPIVLGAAVCVAGAGLAIPYAAGPASPWRRSRERSPARGRLSQCLYPARGVRGRDGVRVGLSQERLAARRDPPRRRRPRRPPVLPKLAGSRADVHR